VAARAAGDGGEGEANDAFELCVRFSEVLMYRVFLVDDRPLPRAALRALLSGSPDVVVHGEAADLTGLDRVDPTVDAVIADFGSVSDVPPPAELSARLVLINVPRHARAEGFARAAGWLDPGASLDDLLGAVATIDRGGRHVAPALDGSTGPAEAALSPREFAVMCALAAGRTNREIAADLGISVKTIDTHRGHVLKKLALRNNSDITRYAVRHGYLRA
jgi:DNA-binding NarL/FixJ family response regulator